MDLRTPNDADWPEIFGIANRSVADVPGAGDQADWLTNRRSFASHGSQAHFVVDERGQVVGYGALEHDAATPAGHYRLFVVVDPDQLDSLGDVILRRLGELLDECGAVGSWFVEYADDRRLVPFIKARGYVESRRFALPSGLQAVVLTKSLRRSA
jgi:hypothetical protein